MKPLVVLGSLNMDLVVRTPRLPRPGETVLGTDFQTVPGGKGANQAVAAAHLRNGGVEMIGRVGADPYGEALRTNLEANGVASERVIIDQASPTGVALIGVEESGQNQIIVYSGANGEVSPSDVDRMHEAIAGAAALIAQFEVPLQTVTRALTSARSAGTPTILNPAPAVPIDPKWLEYVDYLIPNESEAGLLADLAVNTDEEASAAADRLKSLGARNVIVTLGERGALWSGLDGEGRATAHPVKAVDTTAAGDAFIGAFAVALAEGRSLRDAVEFGCAAGALAVTRPGAQPSLPRRAELNAFLQR